MYVWIYAYVNECVFACVRACVCYMCIACYIRASVFVEGNISHGLNIDT